MEREVIVALIVDVGMIEGMIDIRRIVQHLVVGHKPHAARGEVVVETLAEQLVFSCMREEASLSTESPDHLGSGQLELA